MVASGLLTMAGALTPTELEYTVTEVRGFVTGEGRVIIPVASNALWWSDDGRNRVTVDG